jgi:tripartite-type tricarboxylate transporter receptor subunit TctC
MTLEGVPLEDCLRTRRIPFATRRCLAIGCGMLPVFLALAPILVDAEDWPNRPIRWVVPFAPGGGNDIIARLMAPALYEALGQPVVVDNRPGAAGNVGSEMVAHSPPDGYTWLILATPNAINESLYSHLGFSLERDFAPVSLLMTMPNVLEVSNELPVHSVAEFVAYAKAHPGKLNYGSGGIGSTPHMAAELFKAMTGVQMTHIPYRGGGPALAGLIAGQVQVLFDVLNGSIEQIKAGNSHALAVTSRQRSPALPDLPTIAEAGVPGYEVTAWFGLALPAHTERAIIERLNRVTVNALGRPELKRRIDEMGATAAPGTPEEMAGFMHAEIAKWAKVVQVSGAKVD